MSARLSDLLKSAYSSDKKRGCPTTLNRISLRYNSLALSNAHLVYSYDL